MLERHWVDNDLDQATSDTLETGGVVVHCGVVCPFRRYSLPPMLPLYPDWKILFTIYYVM